MHRNQEKGDFLNIRIFHKQFKCVLLTYYKPYRCLPGFLHKPYLQSVPNMTVYTYKFKRKLLNSSTMPAKNLYQPDRVRSMDDGLDDVLTDRFAVLFMDTKRNGISWVLHFFLWPKLRDHVLQINNALREKTSKGGPCTLQVIKKLFRQVVKIEKRF